jgi:hypothetical protein
VTTRTARITWRTREQGGHHVPPSGPQYIAPARFVGAADQTSCGAWSLVVNLVSRPAASTDWIAEVRFLVGEAPQEWLAEGARFELYEGKKCVGQGTVLVATAIDSGNTAGVGLPAHETNLTK